MGEKNRAANNVEPKERRGILDTVCIYDSIYYLGELCLCGDHDGVAAVWLKP